MRRMPPEARELRARWRSLTGSIPDLTRDLERDFRFGQRIARTERGYLMGGTIKGGSSSIWYPTTRLQYKAYRRWKSSEGIVEKEDRAAFERLVDILGRHQVTLTNGRSDGEVDGQVPYNPELGHIYDLTARTLAELPVSHLAREEFSQLRLGGWGPDSAKASAYSNSVVIMYDFALRGARRTYVGLLLHELGHAHEHSLPQEIRTEIHGHYKTIAEADAFLAVEFLLDRSTRRLYQKFVFNEFLAETYLLYTATGSDLRAFVAGLDPAIRGAWEQVYEVFRATFDGVEYE